METLLDSLGLEIKGKEMDQKGFLFVFNVDNQLLSDMCCWPSTTGCNGTATKDCDSLQCFPEIHPRSDLSRDSFCFPTSVILPAGQTNK